MSARIAEVTCSACLGSGKVNALEERTPDGWVANWLLPFDLADAWIAQDGDRAPVRWREIDCPKCGGKGSYLVEFPRCKIF